MIPQLIAVLIGGGMVGFVAASIYDGPGMDAGSVRAALSPDRSAERYFARCADAWAAGVAPIHAGQPGYRPGLDGDSDGIACEPYRR